MFQNSANLIVLKFKCAKFQIKKKSRENENSENLFVLKFKCAKFQAKKKSRKNDLLSSRTLKKKSQFFNLKWDFFLTFQKNINNFENSKNLFIVNLMWANFDPNKKNFLAGGRSVGRAGGGERRWSGES